MNKELDIVIACPGLPFNGETVTALGGSETACKEMASALAGRGHKVTVFCNTEKPGVYDKVSYMNLDNWGQYASATPHDVSIVQRLPDMFGARLNSKLNLLWMHDLAMGRNKDKVQSVMWNIDSIICVSDWHKKQATTILQLPEEYVYGSRNGIDPELIKQAEGGERDPNKLIYAARPERGLDILLEKIFPRLLQENPDFYLCIAGYGNTTDHMRSFYQKIDDMIAGLGDRVKWLGELSKTDLYHHYKTAGAYVYPTPSPILMNFRETSCITAMECMACGLPFVSTERGALPETLVDYAGAFLVDDLIGIDIDAYIDNFVNAVMEAHDYAKNGKFCVDLDSIAWAGVAQEWESKFWDMIHDRNEDDFRLALDLKKNSDIVPLLALAEKSDNDVVKDLTPADLTFIENSEAFYNGMNKKWGDDCFHEVPDQLRYMQLKSFIGGLPDRKNVLDYGCSYGGYLIHLANEFPDKTFVGYDFDEKAIERARELVKKFAKNDNVYFHGTTAFAAQQGPFDLAICCEVLEHCPKPWDVLDIVEGFVKPKGLVFFSVPFGPWEFGHDDVNEHLWHFNTHDLRDMLRQKDGVIFNSMNHKPHSMTGDPMGWWLVTYMATGKPTNRVDIDRHLALQRPPQTVTLSMIAGPNSEEQLRWVLNSVKNLIVEIVVGDCGLSTEAQDILLDYGATIIPAGDPKELGFDVVRNKTLPFCSGDWILWLDTDEKLLEGHNLLKYLRQSLFNGFGMRQHHFAIDKEGEVDKPVRLFRNPGKPGNDPMQWYGVVHEHPETAINEGPGLAIVVGDVHIAHTGYLVESIRKKRFSRNWPLMQKDAEKYPERKLQKTLMMRDKMILIRDRMNAMGGTADDVCRDLAEEIVALYNEHFLGKSIFLGSNPAQYHSQALEILGRGIDYDDYKAAGALDVLSNRYESPEQLIKELSAKLEAYQRPRASEDY